MGDRGDERSGEMGGLGRWEIWGDVYLGEGRRRTEDRQEELGEKGGEGEEQDPEVSGYLLPCARSWSFL